MKHVKQEIIFMEAMTNSDKN